MQYSLTFIVFAIISRLCIKFSNWQKFRLVIDLGQEVLCSAFHQTMSLEDGPSGCTELTLIAWSLCSFAIWMIVFFAIFLKRLREDWPWHLPYLEFDYQVAGCWWGGVVVSSETCVWACSLCFSWLMTFELSSGTIYSWRSTNGPESQGLWFVASDPSPAFYIEAIVPLD